jgi:aminoglycoside phosphotransferase (APT) family kinase protein
LLHADLHPANLLTRDGNFCGVVDFGDMCAGDPACDLAAHRTDTRPGLAWTPIAGQLLPVEASVRAGSSTLTCDGASALAGLGQARASRRAEISL